MTRVMLISALAVALSACSAPTGPAATTPAQVPPAAAPTTPETLPAGADECGAVPLQYLIGKNRSEIPDNVRGGRTRIACTSCPVTMDYSASRLNIFFDQRTGVIQTVKCG